MAGVGTVLLEDVWLALDHCLPGYRKEEKTHHWWFYPPNEAPPYRTIPKGEHSSRSKVHIERGHVKKMSRQFGVLDCVLGKLGGG